MREEEEEEIYERRRRRRRAGVERGGYACSQSVTEIERFCE